MLEDLLQLVRMGHTGAVLALYDRYEDLVRRQSSRFGQHVTFDIDDARQTAFISMLTAVDESTESTKDFTLLFENRAVADLKDEAARQRFRVVVPLRTFRYVMETAARFNNDFIAARDYLDAQPERRRITKDTFDAVFFWAFSIQLEWSSPVTGEPASDFATDAFIDFEDRDAVESLLATLTDTEREVIERTYGLAEFEPQTSEVVGQLLGMTPKSIRRIHSRVVAKLLIHSDLPAHYTVPETTDKDRLRSTAPRTTPKHSTPTSFPVTVTRIHEREVA